MRSHSSPLPSPDDILSLEEASRLLKLSVRTTQKLVASGKLPMRRAGHQWRVRRGALLAWLDGRDPNTNQ